MSELFEPPNFAGAAPRERIAICRKMAADAKRLASSKHDAAEAMYLDLADQWSTLADDIEAFSKGRE
jgi:hypothetical protein